MYVFGKVTAKFPNKIMFAHSALKMETKCSPETTYQTTLRHILKDSNRRRHPYVSFSIAWNNSRPSGDTGVNHKNASASKASDR
jgi:hypothetical protein